MARVHLHADDCPVTLGLLGRILRGLHGQGTGVVEVGYKPSQHGVWVDWDALESSWLSSTERAAVVVARGIAAAEREGGWPPRLRQALIDAVGAL